MKVLSSLHPQAFAISVLLLAFGAAPLTFAAPPQPPQFTELGHEFPSFETAPQWGFAVGDFDCDGKEDFAAARRSLDR